MPKPKTKQPDEETKKKKSKKQLVAEKKKDYVQVQKEKEAQQEFEKWRAQQEMAEKTKKIDPYAGVNLEKAPGDLSSILEKSIYALEKNADKEDVVEIMKAIQEQINKYATKQDAEALGIILQKIAARRPDAWEELNKIAAEQGAKGGLETQAVVTIEEGLTKKYKVPPNEVGEWLNNYGRLGKSELLPEEMMRVIGVVEFSKGKGKVPLQVTEDWLKLGKLKKPMTLMEEASLLLELHKRDAASAEYLMKHAFELEDKMFEIVDKNDLKALGFAFQDVIRSSTDLDDAIFKSLKHENFEPVLKGTGVDIILDESADLNMFVAKLKQADTTEAKKILGIISKMKDTFGEPFIARTALIEIAGSKIGDELSLAQGKRAQEARQLFQSIQWSVIKEKLQLFGKKVIVGKLAAPFIEFGQAWKWGAAKEAGTWRPRAIATRKLFTRLGIAGGAIAVAAGLAYGSYWFFYKKPTEKAIEQFRKDFKKDFKTDFPLSDEAIKFYYGTDEGKRVLIELQDMYPTPDAINKLLNLRVASSEILKEQVLELSGVIIRPSKFDDLLESLMKKAKTSTLEPEELVAESFKEWRKKGYIVTPGENYILQYCKTLDIPVKYIKEFMKNEEAFLKMWDLVNSGYLPRSKAVEYAEIAMGDLPYKEKQEKLNAIKLKNPIVKDSLMDVLDQYALVNADLASYYGDLLERYNSDSTVRENLNGYKIKDGEAIYGNLFGLLAFADEVAKRGVSEATDPGKNMISGEADFMSPKGLPKEKHYWIWIGTDAVMKYFPNIAMNENQLEFLMKYSGVGEVTHEPTGMLKWFMDNRDFMKDPSKVLDFISVSEKLLDEKYYNKNKDTYNYTGIEAYLNKKLPTLKKEDMLYSIEVHYEPEMVPTELIPRTEAFVAVAEEKVNISKEVREQSKGLLAYLPLALDNLKETDEYRELTKSKKKGGAGMKYNKLLGKVEDYFLLAITKAREGDPEAKAVLDQAGLELKESAEKEGVVNVNIINPLLLEDAIKNMVLAPEYEKMKK